jgi:hypothetical protein
VRAPQGCAAAPSYGPCVWVATRGWCPTQVWMLVPRRAGGRPPAATSVTAAYGNRVWCLLGIVLLHSVLPLAWHPVGWDCVRGCRHPPRWIRSALSSRSTGEVLCVVLPIHDLIVKVLSQWVRGPPQQRRSCTTTERWSLRAAVVRPVTGHEYYPQRWPVWPTAKAGCEATGMSQRVPRGERAGILLRNGRQEGTCWPDGG